MDAPETDNDSGPRAARRRSSRATVSGSTRSIADVPFRFEADDPARAAVLDELSAAWDPVPEGSPSDRQLDPVRFRFTGEQLTLPTRPADATAAAMSAWRVDDGVMIDDRGRSRAHARDGVVTVSGQPRTRDVERVAGPLLGHVLGSKGSLVLHAAALLLPGGGAVVATGPSGAGKSTLVAVALREGWDVLADDLCVVRANGGLNVTGVPRPPSLPPEVADGLGGVPVHGDGARGRVRLPTHVLQPGWHPVVALLHIDHGEAPASVLESRGQRQGFDDLLQSRPVSISPTQLRHLLPLCAALSRLPGYRLRHGRDASDRSNATAARLHTLAAAVEGEVHGSAVPRGH